MSEFSWHTWGRREFREFKLKYICKETVKTGNNVFTCVRGYMHLCVCARKKNSRHWLNQCFLRKHVQLETDGVLNTNRLKKPVVIRRICNTHTKSLCSCPCEDSCTGYPVSGGIYITCRLPCQSFKLKSTYVETGWRCSCFGQTLKITCAMAFYQGVAKLLVFYKMLWVTLNYNITF